jgi:hypothetical protein
MEDALARVISALKCFGFELAGLAGAIAPLALFGCAEIFLPRAHDLT